jgi:hypothetical protein
LTSVDDVVLAEAGAVAGQGMCAEAVAAAVGFADRQEDLLANLDGQRAGSLMGFQWIREVEWKSTLTSPHVERWALITPTWRSRPYA